MSNFSKISLFSIKDFLSHKGWVKTKHPNQKLEIYNSPSEIFQNNFQIILPKYDYFLDVDRRVNDAVNIISNLYSTSKSDVYNDIKASSSDLILFRNIEADSNSIPLEVARNEIYQIRNLFIYAASSERKALRHFDQPLSSSDAVMNNFHFAHTFQGSFGLSIEVPVICEAEQLELKEAKIERRVVERVVRGLSYAEIAVKEGNIDKIVDNYKTGLNSRMCDALASLGDSSNASIEIGIKWAKNLQPAKDVAIAKKHVINKQYIEVFKEAGAKLREVKPEDSIIIGIITNLHCTDLSNDSRRRTITIKYTHDEYGNIDIQSNLNTAMYLKALEAHKENKKVQAIGLLERSGATWILSSISKFDIV